MFCQLYSQAGDEAGYLTPKFYRLFFNDFSGRT